MNRPTAAALLEELRQQMLLLLLDPTPLERAPAYYLDHWLQILARIQELLATIPPP
jgi:hypothetical protein